MGWTDGSSNESACSGSYRRICNQHALLRRSCLPGSQTIPDEKCGAAFYSFTTASLRAASLVTSIAITAYFVIGSRLEEKKLILYFGEQYKRYQKKVPGLLPLPWKYLSKTEVEKLVEQR